MNSTHKKKSKINQKQNKITKSSTVKKNATNSKAINLKSKILTTSVSKHSLRSLTKEDITEINIIPTRRSKVMHFHKKIFDNTKHGEDSDTEYKPGPNEDSNDTESSSSEYEYNDVGKKVKKQRFPRECPLCSFEAQGGKELWHHYLNFHPKEKYPFAQKNSVFCNVCGIFVTKSALYALHQHNEAPIECSECREVFSSRVKLHKHKQRKHGKIRFICDVCDKEFKIKYDIILHMRAHMGVKPYKCPHCDYRVVHKGNLKPHLINKHRPVIGEDSPVKKPNNKRRKKDTDTFDELDEPLQKITSKSKKKIKKIYKKTNES